jgi:hypothetical protein
MSAISPLLPATCNSHVEMYKSLLYPHHFLSQGSYNYTNPLKCVYLEQNILHESCIRLII